MSAATPKGRSLNPKSASDTVIPKSRKVLLLVDFLNPLNFPGAEDLAPSAVEAARNAASLKEQLVSEGWATIYVNDNFGQWRSDIRTVLSECRRSKGPASKLARLLAPTESDLLILKPRHSGFHATPLELLLGQLGTKELVITGLATDYCIQCTAMDAYVRGYKLHVPSDCTAAESETKKVAALQWMKEVLKADVSSSSKEAIRGSLPKRSRRR